MQITFRHQSLRWTSEMTIDDDHSLHHRHPSEDWRRISQDSLFWHEQENSNNPTTNIDHLNPQTSIHQWSLLLLLLTVDISGWEITFQSVDQDQSTADDEKAHNTSDDVNQSQLTPFTKENSWCQQDTGGEQNIINGGDNGRGKEIQRSIKINDLNDHGTDDHHCTQKCQPTGIRMRLFIDLFQSRS